MHGTEETVVKEPSLQFLYSKTYIQNVKITNRGLVCEFLQVDQSIILMFLEGMEYCLSNNVLVGTNCLCSLFLLFFSG